MITHVLRWRGFTMTFEKPHSLRDMIEVPIPMDSGESEYPMFFLWQFKLAESDGGARVYDAVTDPYQDTIRSDVVGFFR